MENVFILNPSLSCLELIDAINRRLENTQSIADYLSLSDHKDSQPILFASVLGTISDLLDELKLLFDALCSKIKIT